MVSNPPEGTQGIIPYLYYEDAPAALDFLCEAFGFEERFRMQGDEGKLMHAEIALGNNVVMLASVMPETGMASPQALSGRHGLVMAYVDDVDDHHLQAVATGAKITSDPENKFYGDRMYGAEDPEGHHWYFATHFKDVAPEDMHP